MQGSPPGSRTNPAAAATIRSTPTSVGSIGRTASGSNARKPTSETSATTKTPGRHATGRHKEHSPGRGRHPTDRNIAVAEPLDELAQRKDGQLRFQPVDPAERQQFGQRGQEYRKYLQQRQQLEANAARTPGGDPATAAGPARRKFSRSPFVAPPADQLGRDYAPPQRHQVLKPDFQVQPQPRNRGARPAARRDQGVNQGNRQGASDRPVTRSGCKPRQQSPRRVQRPTAGCDRRPVPENSEVK